MRIFYKYLLFLLFGAGVTACVDDTKLIDDSQNTWREGDTPFVVNLNLKTNSTFSTRAEGEGEGEEEEDPNSPYAPDTKIGENGNIALFFTEDGKYISWSELYSVNPTNTTPGMDKTYTCRFYGFAEEPPRQVLVVCNASDKILKQLTTKFAGWTLDEVYKQIWEEKGILDREKYEFHGVAEYIEDPYENLGFRKEESDDKLYFTLTNTTYIDEDGNLHCAEPITPDGVIIGTDDADADLAAAAVTTRPVATVYLERMVSKFDMDMNISTSEYIPVSAQSLDVCVYNNGEFRFYDYPWALEILGWGMNGLETQNYIFKNVDINGDWKDHPDWNSPDDRRCYWSYDPHYYKDESGTVVYPWQFDNGMDKYNIDQSTWYQHFHSYDETDHNFALTYYPFTFFCPGVNSDGTVKSGFSYDGGNKTIYTPENTFVPAMQVDRTRGTRAYELAGTHIILCARLLIDPTPGGTDYKPFDGNIYRNRVGVCYIDELSLCEDFMNAVNYKLSAQKYMYYKYYPWDETIVSDVKQEMSGKPNGEDFFGQTFRAKTGGVFALYYYNEHDKKYYELTSVELNRLIADPNHYRLTREADAINADGKIIPWIMYNEEGTGNDLDYKALKLFILDKNTDEGYEYSPGRLQDDYDPEKGEVIDETKSYKLKDGTTVNCDKYINERMLKFEYLPNYDKNEEWESVPDNFSDDNDIQSLFFEIWGVADNFRHGLMYYAVPIYAQEKNLLPALGPDRKLEDTTADFNDMSFYYYYGIVRNNWYHFTIHSIREIGIPVVYPDKPIVPNYLNKKDQVKVEMEIIPMHIQEIYVPM